MHKKSHKSSRSKTAASLVKFFSLQINHYNDPTHAYLHINVQVTASHQIKVVPHSILDFISSRKSSETCLAITLKIYKRSNDVPLFYFIFILD